MSLIVTLLLTALVTFLWVGVLAGIWALVSTRDEYPPDVSQVSTNE